MNARTHSDMSGAHLSRLCLVVRSDKDPSANPCTLGLRLSSATKRYPHATNTDKPFRFLHNYTDEMYRMSLPSPLPPLPGRGQYMLPSYLGSGV